MESSFKKAVNDWAKQQHFFREFTNANKLRDFPGLNLQKLETKLAKNPGLVVKKKEDHSDAKYLFDDRKNPDLEYSCSPFYAMYFSSRPDNIALFKTLKSKMREFGIEFAYKKRVDEGYLIALTDFFEELVCCDYQHNEFQKAMVIFESLFDRDFSLKTSNDESWVLFMKTMEGVMDNCAGLLSLDYNSTSEFRTASQAVDVDDFHTFAQWETLSNCSVADPLTCEKKEAVMAVVDLEEELAKFKETVVAELPKEEEGEPTVCRQFFRRFGKAIMAQNNTFVPEMVGVVKELINEALTNDEVFERTLASLNGDFDACLLLVENRQQLIAEVGKKQKELSVVSKKNNPEMKYVNVAANVSVKVQRKDKKKDKGVNEERLLETLKLLGLFGDDHSKAFEDINDLRKKYNQTIDDNADMDFGIDFVTEDPMTLKTKFNMRRVDKGLKIVFDIEPTIRSTEIKNIQRLEVANIFPSHLVPIFNDAPTLNTLQSKIFDSVYNSDENILCCAPTGAGKTNVALISITRLLQRHVDPVTRRVKSDFKVVYLSPLKALAAEIVGKFSKKLEFLGVVVRESTGDISLSKAELAKTNVIVSTPEKWDVMTRKSEELNSIISLLIIDEIHLLDEDRGRVLECLVARTVRLFEAKQCRIRLIGLSATLPNYVDVARFLKVSQKGLFHFDESYRPVPLYKKFIGIKKPEFVKQTDKQTGQIVRTTMSQLDLMNESCYELVAESLRQKKQLLVFVHSRKETVNLAQYLINQATVRQELQLFILDSGKRGGRREFENFDLQQLTARGVGVHNAGIKRRDRTAVEKAFIEGGLSVVVCTATLAWGINMPCHTVIIKGTDFYDPGHGFRPISLLDVQQIFGRAGRPQFDSFGEAILITKSKDLNYFVSMLSNIKPIESHFKNFMLEALLAEVVLGNISNFSEAENYIKSTFFYIRYHKNPTWYGRKPDSKTDDMSPLINASLEELHQLQLIRFNPEINLVEPTELGRIASHYYINCETIEVILANLRIEADKSKRIQEIDSKDLITIVAQATEFEQLSSKPEEEEELKRLKKDFAWLEIDPDYTLLYKERTANAKKPTDNQEREQNRTLFGSLDKIVLLFYGYLYQRKYEVYSLESDTTYVTENGVRILRCMLEIALKENSAVLAENLLVLIRQVENCVSEDQHPLRMFCFDNYCRSVAAKKNNLSEMRKEAYLTVGSCMRLEEAEQSNRMADRNWDVGCLRENPDKLFDLHLSKGNESLMRKAIKAYPLVEFHFEAKPIAQTIAKISVKAKVKYEYVKNWHFKNEHFWVFVADGSELLHHSQFSVDSATASLASLDSRAGSRGSFVDVHFFVPIREHVEKYTIKVMSDHFVDSDSYSEIPLADLKVKTDRMEYTELLNLNPLPILALRNKSFVESFPSNIKTFNPIQTQLFWPMFHSDENVLVGAPTGSGKTIMAELGMFRVFKNCSDKKVVYVAPYKALVKERLKDWQLKFGKSLNKKVLELTGDHTPNFKALLQADVLVTTPEKWDGITRNWQSRAYVRSVALVIFDEIHLLGQDRGAVIEVIVSRMNFIGDQTGQKVRMIGLSTAMANGKDVADWFGVRREFSFNFKPSVRPVPLVFNFRGFNEPNYCPRMNLMNKPAYNDIKKYSTREPVLIFVSSRRQTRLTALDLISLSQSELGTSPFLKMTEDELLLVLSSVKDGVLKQTLSFGVGVHHAGLESSDREIVEHLFVNMKIFVLVATSTLAWGVNFPAKLVIIKGTEFFDAKSRSWVDMPVSDVLQMAGRAGRPQFNENGIVCVYLEQSKKNFFLRYLNDPFPIESNLMPQLEEHVNAEVASGSIRNKQDFLNFLTWTYFFRRLTKNPSFYQLASSDHSVLQKYLINLVDQVIAKLTAHECIEMDELSFEINSTFIGGIASTYYISPKTAHKLNKSLKVPKESWELLEVLSSTKEYSQIPVRHEEDKMNVQLNQSVRHKVLEKDCSSANTKAFLLFQAYLSGLQLPIRDYITDTKLVIDSAFRIINAMIDISAESKQLANCQRLVRLMQMFVQGCWFDSFSLDCVPEFSKGFVKELSRNGVQGLAQLIEAHKNKQLVSLMTNATTQRFTKDEIDRVAKRLHMVPDVTVAYRLFRFDSQTFKPVKSTASRVRPGDEALLEVDCSKTNLNKSMKVELKKWAKDKEYSWWVLVGSVEMDTLFCIKKMNFGVKTTKTFQFDIPKVIGSKSKKVDVLLMNDSFIGIDQTHSFDLEEYLSPVVLD
jgi:activating signal cointegrator complex subunit 3